MSEKQIFAGEYAAVRVRLAAADLTVRGWDRDEILAETDDAIVLEEQDGEAVLTATGDCSLTIPSALPLHFDHIAGNAVLAGVNAPIDGQRVSGDLRLQNCGPLSVVAVSGDVKVEGCQGELNAGTVGGDLTVSSLTGALRAGVGGDLKATQVSNAIAVNTGGHAHIEFVAVSDDIHAIQAGGDIECRLPDNANATLNLQYGGSLRVRGSMPRQNRSGHVSRLVVGAGGTAINLMAGGDISLSGTEIGSAPGGANSGELEDSLRAMADNLEAQLGAMAAQLESQLNGLPWGDEIAARITERVQRAMERAEANVEKAMRKAERAAAKAEQRAAAATARRHAPRPYVSPKAVQPRPAPVSDEERATVLRMVEEGKVTVEQAELLLSAMES
ncbi:MAG: SHOCT-like domain-containing protein [Caldilineaceae bacterium]